MSSSRSPERSTVRTLAILAAVALALPLFAGAARADVVAIKAGRLIDGVAADAVRNVVILIEADRITAVGPTVRIPEGARVIDLSAYTVLPGFIDAHVHLGGRHIGEGAWQESAVRDLPQENAIRGVRNARLTLEAGFTTVRNVGDRDFTAVALRKAIAEGVIDGPRILAAGHSLGITGGHCDTNGYNPGVTDRGPDRGIADGIAEVQKAVRTQVKRGADVIKFCATGGVLSEGDAVGVQQYTLAEMQAIVETSHLAERKVAAHAHGTEGIKTALEAGVDSIEHGSLLDDEAIRMFRSGSAYLVPTLMAQEAVESQAKSGTLTGERAEKALFIAPKARASFTKAAKAGVRIALGSDAGVFPHGTQGREFVLMSENGMTPMAALKAGTSAAADLLGLADQVGSIQTGLIADLVAVEGNPLEDMSVVTRPVFVMHEGRVSLSKLP